MIVYLPLHPLSHITEPSVSEYHHYGGHNMVLHNTSFPVITSITAGTAQYVKIKWKRQSETASFIVRSPYRMGNKLKINSRFMANEPGNMLSPGVPIFPSLSPAGHDCQLTLTLRQLL